MLVRGSDCVLFALARVTYGVNKVHYLQSTLGWVGGYDVQRWGTGDILFPILFETAVNFAIVTMISSAADMLLSVQRKVSAQVSTP